MVQCGDKLIPPYKKMAIEKQAAFMPESRPETDNFNSKKQVVMDPEMVYDITIPETIIGLHNVGQKVLYKARSIHDRKVA